MRVWIDQGLCTGDGNNPGRAAGSVCGLPRNERHVIDAAEDCPVECIVVENDSEPYDEDTDIAAADIVDSESGIR